MRKSDFETMNTITGSPCKGDPAPSRLRGDGRLKMKRALLWASARGPLRLFTTVGSPSPFALSLSKGQAELVEAFVPRAEGFDRLSPNGDGSGLRYLSPSGSLRTLDFRNGPQADACSMRRDSRQARWSH
jgi:hypothetical protein